MSGSWQAERGSRRTRRLPRDDPPTEIGEDVRVGVAVGVGPMEFKLNRFPAWRNARIARNATQEAPGTCVKFNATHASE